MKAMKALRRHVAAHRLKQQAAFRRAFERDEERELEGEGERETRGGFGGEGEGGGERETRGGVEGTELKIKGVSWFGMESRPCAVGGLEQMPVEIGAAFLRKNGFNAVRVPLAVSALLDKSPDAGCLPAPLAGSVSDDDLPAAEASILAAPGVTFVQSGNDGATRGYKTNNPTFVQLGYLRLLERFVTTLGDHGLLVMLDLHASKAGVWPDDGKEYFPGNLRLAWQTLTRRFCDPVRYWNVFAADLRNEPQ